MFVDTIKVFIL